MAVAFFVSAENKGTAISKKGFPGGTVGKESASQCGRCKRHEFDPWVEKIPWRREWQPTPVFLPGRPHGQRSLVGSSPWGHKESDTTECVCVNEYIHTQLFRKVKDTASEQVSALGMGWTEAVSHEAPRLCLWGQGYHIGFLRKVLETPPLVCPKERHTSSSSSSLAEIWGSSCILFHAVSSMDQSCSGLWLGHLSPYPLRL